MEMCVLFSRAGHLYNQIDVRDHYTETGDNMINPHSKSRVMEPQRMNAAFAEAYNSGVIDNLMALYEPGAIHVNPYGETDYGTDAIRRFLTQLLQQKGYMQSNNVYCVPFENLALLRAHFVLHTKDADGNDVRIEGQTAEIARKQADGSWKYVIDHTFGAGPLRGDRFDEMPHPDVPSGG